MIWGVVVEYATRLLLCKKSSVGIEFDTIYDRIRVTTLPPSPRPNFSSNLWIEIRTGVDPTRNRLVIESTQEKLNHLSRAALEILLEGQNGYQTGVRVNSGVNRKSLWSSIKNLALWAVSATEQ